MYLFFILKLKDFFYSKCIFYVKFYLSDIDFLCSELFVFLEMVNIGVMLFVWLFFLLIFELFGLIEGIVNLVFFCFFLLRFFCFLLLRCLEFLWSFKLIFKNIFEVFLFLLVRVVCLFWLLLLFLVWRILLCFCIFCLLLVSLIFGFGLLWVFVFFLELDFWVLGFFLEFEVSDFVVELFLLLLM